MDEINQKPFSSNYFISKYLGNTPFEISVQNLQ